MKQTFDFERFSLFLWGRNGGQQPVFFVSVREVQQRTFRHTPQGTSIGVHADAGEPRFKFKARKILKEVLADETDI